MKKTLWLVLFTAGLLAVARPAAAFDPGAWLSRGIMQLDKKAAAEATRHESARKKFSSGRNHGDTVKRLKKYLKADTGKTNRRSR